MFGINAGWLTYEPFHHYKLPTIVHAGEDYNHVEAVFSKWELNKQKKERFRLPMYRLEWPGVMRDGDDPSKDTIPEEILSNWEIMTTTKGLVQSHLPAQFKMPLSLKWILDQGMHLPTRLPSCVAYHLAVNTDTYSKTASPVTKHRPVGALPGERVSQVLDARFGLNAEHLAALRYLKWHAEGHHRHPLFQGFDTMIREMLMGVSHKAAQLYFKLLGDCLYDKETEWWDRKVKKHWWRLASYFHWLDRTGSGLVHTSGFSDLEGGWDDPEMEDVRLRAKEFEELDHNVALAHVTGTRPGVTVDKEAIGPSIEPPFSEDLVFLAVQFQQGDADESMAAWTTLTQRAKDEEFVLRDLMKYAEESYPVRSD
jgi:hypothetical protein